MRQVFREIKGHCLKCHDTDHSFRTCPAPFTNSSHRLNPELGRLGDNSETYGRWQRRMQSYRRSTHAGDRKYTLIAFVAPPQKFVSSLQQLPPLQQRALQLWTVMVAHTNKEVQGALKAVTRRPLR